MTSVIRGDDDFDSGNIEEGNIASAFTVSASSSTSLNNSVASITTTAGAGTYMIQVTIFGQNGGNPHVTFSSTNVLDGIFDNAIWDGGNPTFTNGTITSGSSDITVSCFGLVRTSGNITINRGGSANSTRRVSWGKLA